VVWLASSRTYLVGQTRSLFRESRRKFGVGADDCVSSQAGVCSGPVWTLAQLRKAAATGTVGYLPS
jgi:hypothetical protein